MYVRRWNGWLKAGSGDLSVSRALPLAPPPPNSAQTDQSNCEQKQGRGFRDGKSGGGEDGVDDGRRARRIVIRKLLDGRHIVDTEDGRRGEIYCDFRVNFSLAYDEVERDEDVAKQGKGDLTSPSQNR